MDTGLRNFSPEEFDYNLPKLKLEEATSTCPKQTEACRSLQSQDILWLILFLRISKQALSMFIKYFVSLPHFGKVTFLSKKIKTGLSKESGDTVLFEVRVKQVLFELRVKQASMPTFGWAGRS